VERSGSDVQRVAAGRLPLGRPPYVRERAWDWLSAHVDRERSYVDIARGADTTPTTVRHDVRRAVEDMLNRGDLVVPGAALAPGRRVRVEDVDPVTLAHRADHRARLAEAAVVHGTFVVAAIATEIVLTTERDGTEIRLRVDGGVPDAIGLGKTVHVTIRGASWADLPWTAGWATSDGEDATEEGGDGTA